MEKVIKHFQELERGKVYLLAEINGMGLAYFELLLAATMEKDQNITFINYEAYPYKFKTLYDHFHLKTNEKLMEREQLKNLSSKLDLEFRLKINKEIYFLEEEYFYAPYVFDQIAEKIKERPTKFVILNDLNYFISGKIEEIEERNWIMKQFQKMAEELDVIFLLGFRIKWKGEMFFNINSYPRLQDFDWSRNMVQICEDIYFLLRFDYFHYQMDERNTAELKSLKKLDEKTFKIEDFSPNKIIELSDYKIPRDH